MTTKAKNIVFVEDNEVVLTAYRIAIEREGYGVQPAKDGLEAMRILHNSVPDLVLLDLLLPKFNGVEVLHFIRSDARLKSLPIIIFSTNSIIDADDEPLLEGVTRRLLKCKCNAPILLQVIRDVFAGITTEDMVIPGKHPYSVLLQTLDPVAA